MLSIRSVDIVNKGYICYASSILQIFSIVPILWYRVFPESNTLLPMLQAISLNIAVKKAPTKTSWPI